MSPNPAWPRPSDSSIEGDRETTSVMFAVPTACATNSSAIRPIVLATESLSATAPVRAHILSIASRSKVMPRIDATGPKSPGRGAHRTLSVVIGEAILVAAIDRIAGQHRPALLIEERMAAHEHRTAAANGKLARDVGRRCHCTHRNRHATQWRAECGFHDPGGRTRDQRRGGNRASDALGHCPVLEANDLVLHQPQAAQSIDLGSGGKLERGRHRS